MKYNKCTQLFVWGACYVSVLRALYHIILPPPPKGFNQKKVLTRKQEKNRVISNKIKKISNQIIIIKVINVLSLNFSQCVPWMEWSVNYVQEHRTWDIFKYTHTKTAFYAHNIRLTIYYKFKYRLFA